MFKDKLEKLILTAINRREWKNNSYIINRFRNEFSELALQTALEATKEPLRTGDGLEDDEIIPDTIQDAFVRQTIQNALTNAFKGEGK